MPGVAADATLRTDQPKPSPSVKPLSSADVSGVLVTDEDIQREFQKFDVNGNGYISKVPPAPFAPPKTLTITSVGEVTSVGARLCAGGWGRGGGSPSNARRDATAGPVLSGCGDQWGTVQGPVEAHNCRLLCRGVVAPLRDKPGHPLTHPPTSEKVSSAEKNEFS